MEVNKFDFLVVGAGFSGTVCSQQLAEKGYKVLLIDQRDHIGGNAYDKYDDNGVLIHPYGPHIFHTNSEKVFLYLSRFTDWRFYEHRVLAENEGSYYPIPINRTTINNLYGLNLKEDEIASFIESVRVKIHKIKTSEDVVLNSVGHDLCERFFRGYTKKQWGLDLSELSPGVAARIPTRYDDDDRYFSDKYQFIPKEGYSKMFENMLKDKNIHIMLDTNFESIKTNISWNKLIFTGCIDEYYNFCFGKLPYRSLKFKHEHFANEDYSQVVGTINFPNINKYTRITEFKHITGQETSGTSIVKEYPTQDGDPYYPIPKKENNDLYMKYKKLSEEEENVFFLGRLAQYKYYNMDQVAAAALTFSKSISENYKA